MAVPWAVAGARVPSGREIAVGARDALAGYTSCPVTKASDDDATTTREINASASTTLVQRRLLHPLCSVRAFPCQILSTRSGSLVALVGIRLVMCRSGRAERRYRANLEGGCGGPGHLHNQESKTRSRFAQTKVQKGRVTFTT
nr:uncharacterized protein LOC117865594 [Setaria viridis]